MTEFSAPTGPAGECFGLAFAQPDPGGPFDCLGGVVEGTPRRFEGGKLPQPCECFSTGRFSAASAGYRLAWPRRR